MEDITSSLKSLFSENFQIVPIQTNRQDQWYKRCFQFWQSINNDAKLLILVPKEARNIWAPKVLHAATNLSRHIQSIADDLQNGKTNYTPTSDKLFPDYVLDGNLFTKQTGLGFEDGPPLSPALQRLSTWKTLKPVDRARGAKALISCQQFESLIYLNNHGKINLKDVANIKPKRRYRHPKEHQGWDMVVDDTLQVLMLLCALHGFDEELLQGYAYENWLPFGSVPNSFLSTDTAIFYLTYKLDQSLRTGPSVQKNLQSNIELCLKVLAAAEIVNNACGMAPIKWRRRISNALLYCVGFESWNREREGDGYLECDLNTVKDDKWLWQMLDKEDKKEIKSASEVVPPVAARPLDPLRLRAAKREPESPEPNEEERAELAKLEALEKQETEYGTKRSTKYQRKDRSSFNDSNP